MLQELSAHVERGYKQLEELKGELAARCEARPCVNNTFKTVYTLVDEARRKERSREYVSEFLRTSREARHRDALQLEKSVRCRGLSAVYDRFKSFKPGLRR